MNVNKIDKCECKRY